MAIRHCALVAGFVVIAHCVPSALSAQRHGDFRVGLSVATPERPRIDTRATTPPASGRTYWKEGGAVTALITVIAMNIWVRDVSSQQRLFGTLALGGVFFVPGALIGGQFPKD